SLSWRPPRDFYHICRRGARYHGAPLGQSTKLHRERQQLMIRKLTRRRFLGRSFAAGLGVLSAPAIFHRGFLGAASPSERVVTGHIGVGGMGSGHLSNFKDQCGAICDVDKDHLDRAAKSVGRYVPLYKDFRQLLDQKDVDAVFIATPDHWHGVMAIYACEAGKD